MEKVILIVYQKWQLKLTIIGRHNYTLVLVPKHTDTGEQMKGSGQSWMKSNYWVKTINWSLTVVALNRLRSGRTKWWLTGKANNYLQKTNRMDQWNCQNLHSLNLKLVQSSTFTAQLIHLMSMLVNRLGSATKIWRVFVKLALERFLHRGTNLNRKTGSRS